LDNLKKDQLQDADYHNHIPLPTHPEVLSANPNLNLHASIYTKPSEMSSFLLRTSRALPAARAFSTSSARNSFAKMTIIGRLADTPELQATSTGQEIIKYAVATNSGSKDNQKTSFFKIAAFIPEGPQRDFISSLDKG
jgi:hypothetical protein